MDFIYLLESYNEFETIYKIGFSKNVDKRLKQHKTSNPNELNMIKKFQTNHKRKIETSLHNLYVHKKIDGEWFKLDYNDILNFDKLCNNLEKSFDCLNSKNFL